MAWLVSTSLAVAAAPVPEWLREAAARPAAKAAATGAFEWLHVESTVEPLPAGGVRIIRRVAARVFDPAAADEIASWAIVYRPADRIGRLQAWTLAADGKAIQAEKKDTSDHPYIKAFSVYEDTRVRVIAARGVVEGVVVGYEDEVTRDFDPGLTWFTFGDVERRTHWSRLSVRVPPGWRFDLRRERLDGVREESRDDGVTLTGLDLEPSLHDTEGESSAADVLPLAMVRWWSPDGLRGFADWNAVGRWFHDLSLPSLSAGNALALAKQYAPSSPKEVLPALEKIFARVAKDVRYVSIQIGIGGYRPTVAAETFRRQYGDCKDKAFLLRAMAEAWSLPTYPVLVQTRDLGRVRAEAPSPAQFNHCIAAVALPEGLESDVWATVEVEGLGRLVLLDPTDAHGGAFELPGAVQGTQALVVHADGGKLVTIPNQPPSAGRRQRAIRGKVDLGGQVEAAIYEESWTGTAAARKRAEAAALAPDELEAATGRKIAALFPGARIGDIVIAGLGRDDAETDRPVTETAKIVSGRIGQRSGNLLLLEAARLAPGVVDNSLLAATRVTALEIGPPRESRAVVELELPSGWAPESLPSDLDIDSPELAVKAAWSFADSRLTYRLHTETRTPSIPVGRYAAFRDAVLRLRTESRSPVVLTQAR